MTPETKERERSLADLVREKRQREGLNLRNAGIASGVAFSTLARIERGGPYSQRVDRQVRAWLNGEAAPPIPNLLDRFNRIDERLNALETDSHPPIDLTDAIIDILASDPRVVRRIAAAMIRPSPEREG